MGKHYLPLFHFLLTPIFFICCFLLLLVLIQINPMFIMLILHIRDAMCRFVNKNTFLGSCHVVVIKGFSHGAKAH